MHFIKLMHSNWEGKMIPQFSDITFKLVLSWWVNIFKHFTEVYLLKMLDTKLLFSTSSNLHTSLLCQLLIIFFSLVLLSGWTFLSFQLFPASKFPVRVFFSPSSFFFFFNSFNFASIFRQLFLRWQSSRSIWGHWVIYIGNFRLRNGLIVHNLWGFFWR